jgi:hypothetical protein
MAMVKLILFLSFALGGRCVCAQQDGLPPAGSERLVGPATGQLQAAPAGNRSAAEVMALRSKAKPLLEFIRAQSSGLAALRREQAASRKQLRGSSAGGGKADPKERKALGKLIKDQRAEMRRATSAARAEHARFLKKNPEAKKALDELLKAGIAVEEPAK